MSDVAISIIMAEYNTHPSHLRRAIKSILTQTFSDFEFIIIDDGTKNDLKSIVGEFNDKRIRVVKNPRNMGLVYSLNSGIRHARGKYIARMDTDDIALPLRLEKQYLFITEHPQFDVVGTKAIEFSGRQKFGILGRGGEKSRRSISYGDSLVHPSVLVKKDTLLSVGCYDNYYRAEDLALWCKMLLNNHRLYVIDEALLHYRVDPSDYSKRVLKYRRGEILARLHYYPKLGASPFAYLLIVKSIIAGILPIRLVKLYRDIFVLKRTSKTEEV